MNTIFSVSLFQQNIFSDLKEKNLKSIKNRLSECEGTDLLILPEMFDTGFLPSDDNYSDNNETLNFLLDSAIKHDFAIAGSIIFKESSKFYNRFLFAKPDGTYDFYDKKHLFALAGENDKFTAGNSRKLVEYKGIKIFPMVCFDLRFPVWSRNVFNYDLLIYVANWPVSRIKQWESLLVARAIENQSYTVGVNRIGEDKHGFIYNGNSLVIDYKGDIIYKAPENEDVIHTIALDFSKQKAARKSFDVLAYHDKFTIS